MKAVILLSIIALAAARPDEKYDVPYTVKDVEELIRNPKLVKNYALCFLGEGPCTPEGKKINSYVPDAIQNNCKDCTEEQHEIVRKYLNALKQQDSDKYDALRNKYDPKGERKVELDEFLSKNDSP